MSSGSSVGSPTSTQVSFCCQRCARPLKLDPSLQNVSLKNFAHLTDGRSSTQPTPDYLANPPIDIHANDGADRKIIIDNTSKDDFCVLAKPEAAKTEAFSYKLRVAMQLFDILSENSEIDHPLCEECTNVLFLQLDSQLRNLKQDCADYRKVLAQLQQQDSAITSQLDEEIEQLRVEEAALLLELDEVSEERAGVAAELAALQLSEKELEREEEQLHREINQYEHRLAEVNLQQKCLDDELKYSHNELEKLKKTNVFNTVFHIWHEGHFGTINGFRLGRLPTFNVEWDEVNAAWGQTALLLYSLANANSFVFQGYKIVPFGSQSYLQGETKLPLFTNGGLRLFWDAKFDQGMVAFLDCLKQFLDSIEKKGSFNFPYKIDKSKIGDQKGFYSIKLHFNSEEQWTKALKFMLINLKWALTVVAHNKPNK